MANQRHIGPFRRLPVINLVRDKAARPKRPEQIVKQPALFGMVGQHITGAPTATVGFFDQLAGKQITFLARLGTQQIKADFGHVKALTVVAGAVEQILAQQRHGAPRRAFGLPGAPCRAGDIQMRPTEAFGKP